MWEKERKGSVIFFNYKGTKARKSFFLFFSLFINSAVKEGWSFSLKKRKLALGNLNEWSKQGPLGSQGGHCNLKYTQKSLFSHDILAFIVFKNWKDCVFLSKFRGAPGACSCHLVHLAQMPFPISISSLLGFPSLPFSPYQNSQVSKAAGPTPQQLCI